MKLNEGIRCVSLAAAWLPYCTRYIQSFIRYEMQENTRGEILSSGIDEEG